LLIPPRQNHPERRITEKEFFADVVESSDRGVEELIKEYDSSAKEARRYDPGASPVAEHASAPR